MRAHSYGRTRVAELGASSAIREALSHLRIARDVLIAAGAIKAAARTRLALKSAEGAARHADLSVIRMERQIAARVERQRAVVS